MGRKMHFVSTIICIIAISRIGLCAPTACTDVFIATSKNQGQNLSSEYRDYELRFGIPPMRNVNISEYESRYGHQMAQIHQKFMAEASENLVGITLIVANENKEIYNRWAPYLKQLIETNSYKSSEGLLESLKKWDLKIATAVETIVMNNEFALYTYRHETPNEIRSESSGKILSKEDKSFGYDPHNKKHAFLWFTGLPTGWQSVLKYEPLIKHRFGHNLYKIKVDRAIVDHAYYTLGDEQESSLYRSISATSPGRDITGRADWSRRTLSALYDKIGLNFEVPADGETYGTFPLSDTRGLIFYLFLQMEKYSRYQGRLDGYTDTGLIEMPLDSWIDVAITANLSLDKNVEAMDYGVDIPPDANTGKWVPGYRHTQLYGPHPDKAMTEANKRDYDSRKYGKP